MVVLVSQLKTFKSNPYGTAKINVNTENQIASAKAVREVLNNDQDVYDPRKYLGPAREGLKKQLKVKLENLVHLIVLNK